jgi:[acyl-carrier-protein] S-malonyltransferase
MTLAVLCPGQGHQHRAMLDVVARDANAQAVLADAADALGTDVRDWLREAPDLTRNAIAQPLICVAQLAAWRALRPLLPAPRAFAGYSVGELASYACADALDAPALCRLAQARANAMDAAWGDRRGGLVAIRGFGGDALAALCRELGVWPAIVVDDTACVVGGDATGLDALESAARAHGARVQRLPVDVPAHTPLLGGAVAPLRSALEASTLRAPAAPVVAGIDGSLVTRRDDAIATLARQVAQTVEWARCLQTLHERGCRVFVELGPGAALSRMVRDRFADADARSLDDFRSLDGAAAWTAARLH